MPHRPMIRRRRLVVPLLAITATGLTGLAATGAAAARDSGSNAQLTTVRVTSTPAAVKANAEAFTKCMRSHGVPDFPGLTVQGGGRVQLKGDKAHPISQSYQAAAKACAHLLPKGTGLPGRPQAPKATPALPCDDCPTPPKQPGSGESRDLATPGVPAVPPAKPKAPAEPS